MLAQLRPAIALTLFFALLSGVAYPLAITAAAQVLFPFQSNGSPISRNGVVIGSRLIGQNWTADRYVHGRPSAVNDDASTSSGSNLGPSSRTLISQLGERVAALGGAGIPVDLVTASGSGLDPDISPAAAQFQARRVAAARGISEDAVRALIVQHTQGPDLGILGQAHVNVLDLNLALDELKP